ncbi:putative O-linked N-acetylglucosamine transferase (SPINDLY family) [Paraburkholderia unamae]|uniref:O-linked N-acetylglucosamine transferase, SPINDLY family protein n=1 Tax=Paraburkholderia unamae TaxID=219649 RepID=UPI000DC37682|nr:tetratricopeptide repeat protein [Paraburkholderia unamae]RAR66123.1 putative O-linked N-acetylglucosamine transferase (SPINDLY family) [Paraburkholderia unamae]
MPTSQTTDAPRPEETFAAAEAAWQRGETHTARTLCERLIAANPHDANALNLAGLIESGRDPLAARALIGRALAEREDPLFLVNFAMTCQRAADRDIAIRALHRAIELLPDFPVAHNNLGHLYGEAGDCAQATRHFERAIALAPAHAAIHFNYGTMLHKAGEFARAEALLRRTLDLAPGHVNAWNNLAQVLLATHRTPEALSVLEHAHKLAPESVDVLTNLGCVLLGAGRIDEAKAALERALERDPGRVSAWNNLGNLLMQSGHIDEARAAFDRAIAIKPDFADAHINLGNAHSKSGDIGEAIACYRRAMACHPAGIGAHSNLLWSLMFAVDDGHALRAEAEQFSARHESALLAASEGAHYANTPEPARRLRIGYVSPDFRHHCQSLFTTPLLRHHDHAAFDIVCYSLGAKADEVTNQLRSFADIWRDVHDFDDARLARQIRDDRIDVLVDLTMHMDGARRLLFARRPAPVQAAWLAYPGTTGSPSIGWRLTDPWLDPVGPARIDDQYTERSLRLPDSFWCYDALAPGVDVNPLPAQSAGHITFGCLNNPCKLTEATLTLWSGVFAALPESRLLLMAPPGRARERLAARFAAHGIDPARVSFVGFQGRTDYLRTYGRIDIALDTFPANGHTTSLDAFWMGVPVPTRYGRSAVSRAGLCLLANLGLPELAASSDAGYLAALTSLARDLPRLTALRAGLRARMQASPLMDGARFARNMEAAFRHMWKAWCTEQRAAPGAAS